MRKFHAAILPACCGLALAFGPAGATTQQAVDAARPSSHLDAIRKVSALLGTDVQNQANEKVADLSDLVLSPEGAIRYAILSHGGLAGVGAKYLAVPWGALDVRLVNGKWAANLDTTNDALDKAPRLESDTYKELTDPDWVAKLNNFFRPRVEGRERAEAARTVLRASKIKGATLKNKGDEDVGAVADLLLDRVGRVAYAVVGRGGVLGIGEKFVPIPWSKLGLKYDRESGAVTAVIDATKQRLEQAPLIEGDNYSTLLAPGFAEQVDRYFGVKTVRRQSIGGTRWARDSRAAAPSGAARCGS